MRSLGVCLRTRQALQEDTLESVMDRYVRRELVQQMLSVTSGMSAMLLCTQWPESYAATRQPEDQHGNA